MLLKFSVPVKYSLDVSTNAESKHLLSVLVSFVDMFVPRKVFVNTFDILTDRQCTRKLPRGLSDPMANDGGGGDNHDHGQQVLDLRHPQSLERLYNVFATGDNITQSFVSRGSHDRHLFLCVSCTFMINYIVVSGVASLCKSSITDARGANYIEHGGHNDEQTVG